METQKYLDIILLHHYILILVYTNIYTDKLQQNVQAVIELLKTRANPLRLMMLCHLVKQKRTVNELEKLVNLGQSALSQHLSRLRYEGILECRREGHSAYYSLKDERARRVIEKLYENRKHN